MYMTYTVIATGVSKSFGDQVVLDGVDLRIESGTVLGLLGPNGAGKTTMVRILATLLVPDAGVATVAGHDLLGDPVGVRRSISLTGQYSAVDDLLTGKENLEMIARLRHLSRPDARRRVDDLLLAFGLEAARDRKASSYSGGMRRRLDLAMSMVVEPKLLFLDEPTTGLDPSSREQLWDVICELTTRGVTVLLTTQYLDEADRLAEDIVVLNEGRVVAGGKATDLKETLGASFIRLEFDSVEELSHSLDLVKAAQVDGRRRVVDVATDGTSEHLYATLSLLRTAGVHARKIEIVRPTLDDVFRTLTSDMEARPKEVA